DTADRHDPPIARVAGTPAPREPQWARGAGPPLPPRGGGGAGGLKEEAGPRKQRNKGSALLSPPARWPGGARLMWFLAPRRPGRWGAPRGAGESWRTPR